MVKKNITKNTNAKCHLSLTVDKSVFEQIEKERGLIPRAVFVNEKLKEIFSKSQGKVENE